MAMELENMGIPHRVEMSESTHKDEIENPNKGEGWIDTPRGKRELRRIPFLAKLRNRTLQDLIDLQKKGQHFDKVLFLNDVVFTVCYILTVPWCIASDAIADRRCSQTIGHKRRRLCCGLFT